MTPTNQSSVFRGVFFIVSFAAILVSFCLWLGDDNVVQSRRNQPMAITNSAYSGVVPSTISGLQTTQPSHFSRKQTNGPSITVRVRSIRPSRISNEVIGTTPVAILDAGSNCSAVVPRILHLAWYGSKTRPTFRFHHVISVMSSLRFIQPERIMFWHDRVPTGK